jgi:hypothetical protein
VDNLFGTQVPPFETEDLRRNLSEYLDTPFIDELSGSTIAVGNYRWGVYVFYDYDGEPIYVGQTNEMLRTRIRRHLTNQRTDAVAMSVLDPFEVFEIEVFPMTDLQTLQQGEEAKSHAKAQLNALERAVYERAIESSKFGAILNEKDPPSFGSRELKGIHIPKSFRGRIVSNEVANLRSHPDFRIARRSLVISRLAQVISERKVQGGLRRVLLTQAMRLRWLASERYKALGGAASVETEYHEENEKD